MTDFRGTSDVDPVAAARGRSTRRHRAERRDEARIPQALVYCRVSTKRQGAEGTSLDSQRSACVEHAERAGYHVARVTQEVFSGAELWDRPKLSDDRADIHAGTFDVVVVYSTDRLSRNPVHLAIIAEECERAGVSLEFVTEPLDSTPEGALIRYVKGYAAALEREKIRERQLRGKRTRALAGKLHNSGHDLYGYHRDRELGRRVIVPDEAAVVRRIFHDVARGASLRGLARALNDEGISAPSAGKVASQSATAPKWGHSCLSRILAEPAYKGVTYAWRWQHVTGKVSLAKRPEDEWIALPEGTTPAIVPEDLWERVQVRPAGAARARERNVQSPFLLRGLIVCGACGRPMRAEHEKGVRVYRCSSRETHGGACGGKRVPAEARFSVLPRDSAGHVLPVDARARATADVPGIDAWTWDQVAAVLRNPQVIAAEVEHRKTTDPDPALPEDVRTAERGLLDLDRQQQRLIQRYSEADDDAFPWEVVQREIGRIEDRKRELERSGRELRQRMTDQADRAGVLEALSTYCDRVARNLDSFTFDEKRLALEALQVQAVANGADRHNWRINAAIPITPEGGETDSTSRCYALRPRPPPTRV